MPKTSKKSTKKAEDEPTGFFAKAMQTVNNSKFFAGLVMLMINIGSKYITIELSKTQEAYLKYTLARQLLIFSLIWMGTLIFGVKLNPSFFVFRYAFHNINAINKNAIAILYIYSL